MSDFRAQRQKKMPSSAKRAPAKRASEDEGSAQSARIPIVLKLSNTESTKAATGLSPRTTTKRGNTVFCCILWTPTTQNPPSFLCYVGG